MKTRGTHTVDLSKGETLLLRSASALASGGCGRLTILWLTASMGDPVGMAVLKG